MVWWAKNRNSFGFADGLDGVDLIETVNDTFAVSISDDESAEVSTFGELLDLIEAKCNTVSGTWLMRIVLRRLQDKCRDTISPKTPLSTKVHMGRNWKDLFSAAGLNFAATVELDRVLGITSATWFCISAAVGFGLWSVFGHAALLFGPMVCWAIAALTVWPRVYPQSTRALADLIRSNMHVNYKDLSNVHGHGNASDRRRTLEAMCRDISGYSGPINQNTTFYA